MFRTTPAFLSSTSLRPHRSPAVPPRAHPCSPLACARPARASSPARRALLRAAALAVASAALPRARCSAARCLPEGAAPAALADVAWPDDIPFARSDFARFDETPDAVFYSSPRIVRHIDPPAVAALTAYYKGLLPDTADVLDVCASVEAYLPERWPRRRVVAGVGMNEVEMAENLALTENVVRDLNADPRLPFEDGSFDLVMCNVSIDYLTKPVQVAREMGRVLRKGGKAAISFSDRVFGTKAIAAWMSGGDQDHVYIVGAYLHYAGGFATPKVLDLTPRKGGKCTSDPLYVVQATKI